MDSQTKLILGGAFGAAVVAFAGFGTIIAAGAGSMIDNKGIGATAIALLLVHMLTMYVPGLPSRFSVPVGAGTIVLTFLLLIAMVWKINKNPKKSDADVLAEHINKQAEGVN
jgi:hypothetical protein